MKKHLFRTLLALSLLVVLALAACSGESTSSENPDDSSDQSNEEDNSSNNNDGNSDENASEGSGKDTLVFGRGADSKQLDPSKVTDGESIYVTQQIYDQLVTYEQDSTEVKPALATDWKTSDDGTVWTFTLREGVKFHDGTSFEAEDVVYNFERWTKSKDYIYYGYMFGGHEDGLIEKVEAVDEYTVKFTLKEPNAPFIQTLAMPPFGIASPDAIEKHGENYFKNPVGTGPFKFESWTRGDRIELSRNDDFWGQKAGVKNLTFRVIPDNGARFMELQSGSIDLMLGLNPQDLEPAENADGLQVFRRPSMNVGYMAMNTDKEGPLADRKVRQAINLAVDKKELIKLFEGLGKSAKNPMPPSLWGYNDDIDPYGYDVEKAKTLLAEAGYGDGIDITLYTMPNPRPYMPQPKVTAQAIQQMLKEANINVEIVENDWETHLEVTQNGEHDMALLGWTGDNGDPDNFLYVLLDKDNAKVGSAGNIAFYKNDEVHDLLKSAQSEMEQSKRAEKYKKAQEIIHKDAPWLPIAHTTPPLVGKDNIKGYVPHATGSEKLHTITFE
ncbi:ABC transporter substrate-binding protein [Pontibacillus marinus]|uniref:Peptide ABC transporter substrate-binding protein n=1 Tax=Pontibacillus marinus BH030004 = DSM 16465 TaxID=1385511 RepID=A0A0A5FUQ2_9BACI|nr:ABC transporter substrate-binding protein [Pontibacillus marinus]KGX83619.1 peptide ABC transporter substrate-binding protein [Pontibacillus marinus BH030004 = DSM 16465]